MSLKVKLISMVSLLMLMLGVLIIGVYAATQTINLRGSVEFDIGDTSLYIRDIRVQTEPTGSAETIDDFIPGYTNQSIDLNLGTIQSNSGSVNVYFDFVNTTSTAYSATATGGSGVVLSTDGIIYNYQVPTTEVTTADISGTITLTIQFTGGTAGNVDLDGIEISIEEYDLTEYSDFAFGITSDSTGEIVGYTGAETNVEIPESFYIMTMDTGVEGYTKTFESMEEFSTFMNGQYTQYILSAGYYYVTTPISERTFVRDFNSYMETLIGMAGGDTAQLFPVTLEATNFEITYSDIASLVGDAQTDFLISLYDRLRYELMTGEVSEVIIEFNSGERFEIDASNVNVIDDEILASVGANSIPINVSYSSLKNFYVEGDDYLVTSIGSRAFYRNTNIARVTIPNSVTSIGSKAFYNCDSLTSITIPDSVISIGEQAFYSCDGLEYNVDDYGVSYLGNDNNQYLYLVDAPTTLTSYTIKDTCKLIGEWGFSSCSSLTSIEIPEGVTIIGDGVFYGCDGLETITVAEGNKNYVSVDGVLFDIDMETIMAYPAGKTDVTYIIPETVTSIGTSAFSSCSSFTSITIPASVTSIGELAFNGCSNLTNVNFLENSLLTSIGQAAFQDCSSLTSIGIPDSVISIDGFAFNGCSMLASITIPEGVTSIGQAAFQNCNSLTSITINATTPPTLGSDAIETRYVTEILVPAGSVDAYKAASGWADFADIISAIV